MDGQKNPTRRRVLTIMTGATALTVMLPEKWSRPIVETIVVPAHAQASPPGTTSVGPPQTTGTPPQTTGTPPQTTGAPPSTIIN